MTSDPRPGLAVTFSRAVCAMGSSSLAVNAPQMSPRIGIVDARCPHPEPRDRLSVVLLAGLLAISSGSDSASCAHAPPAQAAGKPANSDDWHRSPRNRAKAVNEMDRSRGGVFAGERNERLDALS